VYKNAISISEHMKLIMHSAEILKNYKKRLYSWLWILWAASVSILLTGYDGLHGATLCYSLPLVHRIQKPESYPTDPFVDTANAYATVYWHLVAELSYFFDLENLLICLFIISRILYVFSVWFLTGALFPKDGVVRVVATAVAATVPTLPIGSEAYVRSFAEQTAFAFACALLFLANAILKQWLRAMVCLGIVFNLNLMYAIFALSYSVTVVLFHPEYRPQWRVFLTMLPIAVCVGLPGIWLMFSAVNRTPIEGTSDLVWQTAALAFPGHFFIQFYSCYSHFIFLFLLAFILLVGGLLTGTRRSLGYLTVLFTLTSLGWYITAWVNPLFIRSLALLQLHPIRGHSIWLIFSVVIISFLCVCYINKQNRYDLLSISKRHIVISGAGLLYASLSASPRRFVLFLSVFFISWIFVIIIYFLFIRQYFGVDKLKDWLGESLTLPAIIALVSFLCFVTLTSIARYVALSSFVALRKVDYSAVSAMAQWARSHTRVDSVFLIPVTSVSVVPDAPPAYWDSFRHLSERGVFVTWSDGVSWPYAPWYAPTWLERIRALGCLDAVAGQSESELAANYRHIIRTASEKYLSLDDGKVNELRKKYRIDYWITLENVPSRFPEVYRYGHWKVLRVTSRSQNP